MLWRLLFIALIELIQTTVWRSSSSAVRNYHPERAIDGNTDTCAITRPHGPGNSARWRVQLSGIHQISYVRIYSKDQTGTSMTGAPVQIFVESYNNGIVSSKMCTKMSTFKGGQWNNFKCTERVSGRYVTVFLPPRRSLVLCEVEIYSKKKELINTADSITSQSSNFTPDSSYSSGRATDGNELVCAGTKDELGDHWWRIDLLGVYNISCVSIYNQDWSSADITGAQIHVGNSRENNGTNNEMCTKITNFTRGQWNDFKCAKRVSGRYVTVFFPGTKALILCEVKIYGKRKESPFRLIEEKKTWEYALDHCRQRNMDLATILDEDDQTLAELEARNAETRFLWLGLHYTCILEVWFWVADHRLEFNRWAPGEKTGDCDRSAVMSRAEGHQWFSKSDYDEFNFICQEF